MKILSGSGADITRTYVRQYYSLVVLFSKYHVGTGRYLAICLRIYLLLVPYDLFKPKILKTVVIICSIICVNLACLGMKYYDWTDRALKMLESIAVNAFTCICVTYSNSYSFRLLNEYLSETCTLS
jgi:hypothetical protein